MPTPLRPQRTHAPHIQQIIPTFKSGFKAEHPFFYFLHKIDPEKAALTVEVIGPDITFTFNHSRALRSERFKSSEVAISLEQKTVGFLSIVKSKRERHILAWAESGHGLGRSGDMLDAPESGPVLASELWTRRVIHVGKILGIRMGRGNDNMNNTADPSVDIHGIFQGSHVEVKLAVHAVWLMLAMFNITKDLNNVTKKHLEKLKGARWADGTRPAFEVYFSRKNCAPCGNIVRGLSELTGIDIKLLWKDRVTTMKYYKPSKNKQQARRQEKAFLRQDDLADFDDVVARRAEEDVDCSTDCTVMSDADEPTQLGSGDESDTIVIDDDDAPRESTGRLSAEVIDLTGDKAPQPSIEPNRQLSRLMQERQDFIQEMERRSMKSNASPPPGSPPDPAGSHSRPLVVQEMRKQLQQEIRKPLPASSVEIKFVQADKWENGGSRHRTRFLRPGAPVEETRGVSSVRERGGRLRGYRRRGISRVGGPLHPSRQEVRAAMRNRRQRARVTGFGSPQRATTGTVIDLSEESPDLVPLGPSIDRANDSQATRVDNPRTAPHTSPTQDLAGQPAISPTRLLFPDPQPFAFNSSRGTFPSPKPALSARQEDSVAAFHYPTPQLKRSRAANEQGTEVFHYPSPETSTSLRPPAQHANPKTPRPVSERRHLQPQLRGPSPMNEPNRSPLSNAFRATPQAAFAYPKPPPRRLQVAKESESRLNKRPKLSHDTREKTPSVNSSSPFQSTRSKERARLTTPTRRRLGENL